MKQMDKRRNIPKIIDKKLEGDIVYYLNVKGRTKKWINFQHMDIDQLELVMEFEKEQQQRKQSQVRQLAQKAIITQDSSEEKTNSNHKRQQVQPTEGNVVSNIIFLNQIEKQLFFKIFYENGYCQVMSNKQLKIKHPQELIEFYENNVKISSQDDTK